MASNNNRPPRNSSIKVNSKWFSNTLKSLGLASTNALAGVMPATTGTIKNINTVATDVAKDMRSGRMGSQRVRDAINNSPGVKTAKELLKNAYEDLRSGDFYGEKEGRTSGDDMFGDLDTMFDDMDSLFGEGDSSPEVNIQNVAVENENAATLKAVRKSAEIQLNAAKANNETMVSLGSATLLKMSDIGNQIVSELTTINSNLNQIIEYNNNTMTKFVEASIGFYEQMTTKKEDSSSAKKLTADDIFDAKGALDLSSYKDYIKGNISKMKEESLVGGMASMILENKDMFLANPMSMIAEGIVGELIPGVLKHSMEKFDQAFTDFVPVMLEKLGDLGEDYSANPVLKTIGKVFGIRTKREDKFDLSKMEKGPMPYNGIANHTIVEIIPKYLRESTSYLKAIAMNLTGKSEGDLLKGTSVFDWETGRHRSVNDVRNDVYGQLANEVLSPMLSSEFGKKILAQKGNLDESQQAGWDNAVKQLMFAMERHEGSLKLNDKDFRKGLLDQVHASDDIITLMQAFLEKMVETGDTSIGSIMHAKSVATGKKNRMQKTMEEDPYRYNLHAVAEKDFDDWTREEYSGQQEATINPNAKPKKGKKGKAKSVADYKAMIQNNQLSDEDVDAIIQSGGVVNKAAGTGAKGFNYLSGVLGAIMAGNSDQAWDEFMKSISNVFKRAGNFLSENFITPLKKSLFGEKDDHGYLHHGLFEGVNNKLNESFLAFRRMINGKGYKKADGGTVPDVTPEEEGETVIGKLKASANWLVDALKVRIFGNKKKVDKNGKPVEDKGLLGKVEDGITGATSALLSGLVGWKNALFGTSDVTTEENGKKILVDVKAKAAQVAPDAIAGGIGGGLLGFIIGGPIVGALMGMAGGIAKNSKKFKDWLFGPVDDQTKERKGGFLNKETQDYLKENGKFLAGGAGLGLLTSAFTGTGFLGALVGGPVAGVLLGLGSAIALKSKAFEKFIFGDKEGGQLGLKQIAQNWLKNFGINKDGDASLAKSAGMAGIGAIGGGLLGTLMGLTIPGAVLGLGASIIAQKDNFHEWFFGKEENGIRKEGVLGQFKNMLTVNVFHPLRDNLKNIGADFKTFLEFDVFKKLNLALEPIGDAFFSGLGKMTNSAIKTFGDFTNYINENFLQGFIENTRKILSPLTGAVNTIAKGVYSAGKAIISAPVNLLYTITSPIAQAVAHTVGTAASIAFKSVNTLIIKPINALVLRPLGGLLKVAGNVIAAPFQLIADVTNTIVGKIDRAVTHVHNFITAIGLKIGQKFNDAVMKHVSGFFGKIKDAGATLLDKITTPFQILGDFAKAGIKVITNKVTEGIGAFFSSLNPINIIRTLINGGRAVAGLFNRDKDGQPKKDKSQRHGFIGGVLNAVDSVGALWKETAPGWRPDFSGRFDEEGNRLSSNAKARRDMKRDRAAARAGDREEARKRAAKSRNEKLIAKYTKGQRFQDTQENRDLAMAMAGKKAPSIRWGDVAVDKTPEEAALEKGNEQRKDIKNRVEDILKVLTHSSGVDPESLGIKLGGISKANDAKEAGRNKRRNAKTQQEKRGATQEIDAAEEAKKRYHTGLQQDFQKDMESGHFGRALVSALGGAFGSFFKLGKGYAGGTEKATPGLHPIAENAKGNKSGNANAELIYDKKTGTYTIATKPIIANLRGGEVVSNANEIDATMNEKALTGQARRDSFAAEKAHNAEIVRQIDTNQTLHQIADSHKEHYSIWDSIFSKKGLITGAILLAVPLIYKFLKNFNLKDLTDGLVSTIINAIQSAANGAATIIKDAIWTEKNGGREDGNTVTEQAQEEVEELQNGTFFLDETGEVTSQTDNGVMLLGRQLINFVTRNAQNLPGITSAATQQNRNIYKVITAPGKFFEGGKEAFATAAARSAERRAARDVVENAGASLVQNAGKGYTVVDDAGNLLAKTNGKNWYAPGRQGAMKAADVAGMVDNGATMLDDAGKALVTNVDKVDDVSKAGGKIYQTVIKYVDEFFEFIQKVGASKLGKAASAIKNVITKPFKLLKDGIKGAWSKIVDPLTKGINEIFGKNLTAATVSAGLLNVAFATIGTVNGLSGTAKLFGVAPNNVDGTMKLISSIFGLLSSTLVGGIMDLVLQLVGDIIGTDILRGIAVALYSFIKGADSDAVKNLDKAHEEWKNAYVDMQTGKLEEQYNTQIKAGLLNPEISFEEYQQGVYSGEYSATYQSYNDWNAQQNASILDKGMSGLGKGVKFVGNGVNTAKTALFGGKTELFYTDPRGNSYKKNDDGSWQVFGPDGSNLGYISEQAIPEDAVAQGEEFKPGLLTPAIDMIGTGLSMAGGFVKDNIIDRGSAAIKGAIDTLPTLFKYATDGDVVKFITTTVNTGNEDGKGNFLGTALLTGVKGLFILPTSMNWVGNNIGTWIGNIGAGISNIGQRIFKGGSAAFSQFPNILNYMISGDIDNLVKMSVDTGDENGEGNFIGNAIIIGGKLATFIPTFMSWIGHMLWGGFKNIISKVSNSINNAETGVEQIHKFSNDGNPSAIWNTVYRDSDDNPVSGFTSVIITGHKLVNTIPAFLRWTGKTLKEKLNSAVASVKNSINVLGTNCDTILTLSNNGDPHGLWNLRFQNDENNPVGGFTEGIFNIMRITNMPGALLRWTGAKIKTGFNSAVDKVKASLAMISTAHDQIKTYAQAGDFTSMWSYQVTNDENNPVGGFVGGITFINKLFNTPGALIKSAGNNLSTWFTGFLEKTKSNKTNIDTAIVNMKKTAKKGDIEAIWNSSVTLDSDDPLKGIWTAIFTVNKFFTTLSAVFSWLGNKVDDLIDSSPQWVKDVSAFLSGKGGSGGSGTNHPSMGGAGEDELNGVPYYSQSDPAWGNKKFTRSTGEDDGATFDTTGCGPTAMAMVVNGINSGKTTNPVQMGRLAQITGNRDSTGTNANFIDTASKSYGINSERVYAPSVSDISAGLSTGNPMVLLGQRSGSGDNTYTSAGHYVVATGMTPDGQVHISDPRGKEYSGARPLGSVLPDTSMAWIFNKNGGSGTIKPMLRQAMGGRGCGVTANDVVTVAMSQVGYLGKSMNADLDDPKAHPKNGYPAWTKYARDLGFTNNCHWCATFVCWCLWTAANKDVNVVKSFTYNTFSAGCAKFEENFTANGRFGKRGSYNPQPGDLIIFNWNNDGSTHDHIGIVVGCDDKYVYTVEGNTGKGNIKGEVNEYEGSVAHKRYDKTWNNINGYCIPNYDDRSNFKGFDPGMNSSGTSSFFGSIANGIGNGIEGILGIGSTIASFAGEMFRRVLTGNLSTDYTDFWANLNSNNSSDSNYNGLLDGYRASSASSSFSPSQNKKLIWNYLTGKEGLSDIAAAGAMGVWEHESGNTPKRLEGDYLKVFKEKFNIDEVMSNQNLMDTWVRDYLFPIYDRDHVNYGKSGYIIDGHYYPGIGLAQWTKGRTKKLVDYAKSQGKDWGGLDTQLGFFSKELSESYPNVKSHINSASSPTDAALIFNKEYEGVTIQPSNVKTAHAEKIYETYKGMRQTSDGVDILSDQESEARRRAGEARAAAVKAGQVKKRIYDSSTIGGNGRGAAIYNRNYYSTPKETHQMAEHAHIQSGMGTIYNTPRTIQKFTTGGKGAEEKALELLEVMVEALKGIGINTQNLDAIRENTAKQIVLSPTQVNNYNTTTQQKQIAGGTHNVGRSQDEEIAKAIAYAM